MIVGHLKPFRGGFAQCCHLRQLMIEDMHLQLQLFISGLDLPRLELELVPL